MGSSIFIWILVLSATAARADGPTACASPEFREVFAAKAACDHGGTDGCLEFRAMGGAAGLVAGAASGAVAARPGQSLRRLFSAPGHAHPALARIQSQGAVESLLNEGRVTAWHEDGLYRGDADDLAADMRKFRRSYESQKSRYGALAREAGAPGPVPRLAAQWSYEENLLAQSRAATLVLRQRRQIAGRARPEIEAELRQQTEFFRAEAAASQGRLRALKNMANPELDRLIAADAAQSRPARPRSRALHRGAAAGLGVLSAVYSASVSPRILKAEAERFGIELSVEEASRLGDLVRFPKNRGLVLNPAHVRDLATEEEFWRLAGTRPAFCDLLIRGLGSDPEPEPEGLVCRDGRGEFRLATSRGIERFSLTPAPDGFRVRNHTSGFAWTVTRGPDGLIPDRLESDSGHQLHGVLNLSELAAKAPGMKIPCADRRVPGEPGIKDTIDFRCAAAEDIRRLASVIWDPAVSACWSNSPSAAGGNPTGAGAGAR